MVLSHNAFPSFFHYILSIFSNKTKPTKTLIYPSWKWLKEKQKRGFEEFGKMGFWFSLVKKLVDLVVWSRKVQHIRRHIGIDAGGPIDQLNGLVSSWQLGKTHDDWWQFSWPIRNRWESNRLSDWWLELLLTSVDGQKKNRNDLNIFFWLLLFVLWLFVTRQEREPQENGMKITSDIWT